MDFKQLESFVAAVDEGSFSNAADRLQISQSMVTIHIRNLEKELGAKLLNRTTRTMELSPDGRIFYDYASQMLKLNRDSLLALSRADKDDKTIEIVATPYISRYYLTDWVVGFHRLHPQVTFKFATSNNSEIRSRLQRDGCEFAFCSMKITDPNYALKHCGLSDPVVITPNEARYQDLLGQSFPPALFNQVPLITRSSASTLQQEFMRWMKLYLPDARLHVVAAIDDTETIKRWVAAGVGVSVISEATIKDAVASGQVLSFPLEGTIPYHLYFAYKKKYLSPEQAQFRDYILSQVTFGG